MLYRQALVNACLIEFSKIYDVFAGAVVESVSGRVFYTDLELRTWRYGGAREHEDVRLALNRLYLELRRTYDEVYTPRDGEGDFVTLTPDGEPRFWKIASDLPPSAKQFARRSV